MRDKTLHLADESLGFCAIGRWVDGFDDQDPAGLVGFEALAGPPSYTVDDALRLVVADRTSSGEAAVRVAAGVVVAEEVDWDGESVAEEESSEKQR